MPHNFLYIPLIRAAFAHRLKLFMYNEMLFAISVELHQHYFTTKNLGYCYDLENVVSYYSLYSELMQFWQLEYNLH